MVSEVGRGKGEGVAAELVDAGGGGMVEEGEAGGGAGEADPLLVAFAEGFDLGVGVLFGEIEGVDLGLGGVERHGEGADAAKGSGLEDLLGAERTDDGCEKGVGNDKAEAGEADGVDGREDDLAGFVAAEEGGEVGVFDDGERIAGVEGMLADAAAKLNNVAAGLAVCEANGCQFKQVAEHGEEMPGVDSVAARLWGRIGLGGISGIDEFSWGLSGFSHGFPPPTPSKVCKVLETNDIGLDFGIRCDRNESRARKFKCLSGRGVLSSVSMMRTMDNLQIRVVLFRI